MKKDIPKRKSDGYRFLVALPIQPQNEIGTAPNGSGEQKQTHLPPKKEIQFRANVEYARHNRATATGIRSIIDFSAMSATCPKQPRIRQWAAGPLEACLSELRP
ncbi:MULTISPECIES: hypothetical protein [Rhizobium]|uniref:hypothetical protein n=1 Tax=Rhizobium TaxID=379 RepID=UPI001111BBAA|nr:hypothetical protein [Rhizobium miluonense]